MEESIKCFFDNYNDYFYEYVSNVCVNLKKTNRKYQDSCVRQAKLLDNFPNIRKIIEDNGIDMGEVQQTDVSDLDAVCVCAMIVAHILAERF